MPSTRWLATVLVVALVVSTAFAFTFVRIIGEIVAVTAIVGMAFRGGAGLRRCRLKTRSPQADQ
jgi:hypothetical protein